MLFGYLIICVIIVLVMLLVEYILRRGEISDGEKFTTADIQWRRLVAILIGIVLFFALWIYVAVFDKDPLSFLAL